MDINHRPSRAGVMRTYVAIRADAATNLGDNSLSGCMIPNKACPGLDPGRTRLSEKIMHKEAADQPLDLLGRSRGADEG